MSSLSFYCQTSSVVWEILVSFQEKAMSHLKLVGCIKKTIIAIFNSRIKTAEFYLRTQAASVDEGLTYSWHPGQRRHQACGDHSPCIPDVLCAAPQVLCRCPGAGSQEQQRCLLWGEAKAVTAMSRRPTAGHSWAHQQHCWLLSGNIFQMVKNAAWHLWERSEKNVRTSPADAKNQEEGEGISRSPCRTHSEVNGHSWMTAADGARENCGE